MAERQYVVFKLDNEEYGIDIMNVREIGVYQESIKVPNTPDFVEGIINNRGSVIPIVNLKKRFKLGGYGISNNTRIIIINLNDKQIGFIVDEASETLRLDEDSVDPAPSMIAGIDGKYIIGVGKLEERLIILIDLEKVLSIEEKEEIRNMEM